MIERVIFVRLIGSSFAIFSAYLPPTYSADMARHYGMSLAPGGVVGGGKFQTKSQNEERRKKGEGSSVLHRRQTTQPKSRQRTQWQL